MNDFIYIENLKIFAHHGVYEKEKQEGQEFMISAKIYLDTTAAGYSDDLTKTVNYGELSTFIKDTFTKESYDLIETAGHKLADEILLKYELIDKIELDIFKPHAPIAIPFGNVSVHIEKKWHLVYLALGSNIGDKNEHLENALAALRNNPYTRIIQVSDFIITEPVSDVEQDDYLNGVVAIKTILEPRKLLDFTSKVELDEKRTRTIHWGPRTLDIDILLYDDIIYNDEALCIPHIRMHERTFVLAPLCQIAPNAVHPILHQNAYMMLDKLNTI